MVFELTPVGWLSAELSPTWLFSPMFLLQANCNS